MGVIKNMVENGPPSHTFCLWNQAGRLSYSQTMWCSVQLKNCMYAQPACGSHPSFYARSFNFLYFKKHCICNLPGVDQAALQLLLAQGSSLGPYLSNTGILGPCPGTLLTLTLPHCSSPPSLGTHLGNTQLLAVPGSCPGSCPVLLEWLLRDRGFHG